MMSNYKKRLKKQEDIRGMLDAFNRRGVVMELIDNVIHGPAEGHQHAGVTDVASYLEVHSRAMIKKEQNVFEVTDPIIIFRIIILFNQIIPVCKI